MSWPEWLMGRQEDAYDQSRSEAPTMFPLAHDSLSSQRYTRF